MTIARTERRIVLVGTGAYVCRDDYGPGVIARSLAEWCSRRPLDEAWTLCVAYRSNAGRTRMENEWKQISREVEGLPSLEFLALAASDGASGDALTNAIKNAAALFVCVPDDVHRDFIELGLAARTPTWVVKPLTGTFESASFVARLAEETGTPLWVDYHKRFDVSNRNLKAVIQSEQYGAPRLYSVRYSQPRDLPLDGFAWAGQTDVFTYIGCHYVDQLFFLFPEFEVQNVTAKGIGGPVHDELSGIAWDSVIARIDGITDGRPLSAQFEVGWSNPLASPTKSLQVVEVQFDRAKLFLDQMRRGTEIWTDEASSIPNPHFFSRVFDPALGRAAYQGYGYDSIRQFMDCVVSTEAEAERLLASDHLPWARNSVRTEQVLDLVRSCLEESAG